MSAKQRRHRLLSTLSLNDLKRALSATEKAIGADSYSADCLRRAISIKLRAAKRRK